MPCGVGDRAEMELGRAGPQPSSRERPKTGQAASRATARSGLRRRGHTARTCERHCEELIQPRLCRCSLCIRPGSTPCPRRRAAQRQQGSGPRQTGAHGQYSRSQLPHGQGAVGVDSAVRKGVPAVSRCRFGAFITFPAVCYVRVVFRCRHRSYVPVGLYPGDDPCEPSIQVRKRRLHEQAERGHLLDTP